MNYAIVAHGAGTAPVKAAISDDRVFVAQTPGVYTIIAEINGLASRTTLVVRARASDRNVGAQ